MRKSFLVSTSLIATLSVLGISGCAYDTSGFDQESVDDQSEAVSVDTSALDAVSPRPLSTLTATQVASGVGWRTMRYAGTAKDIATDEVRAVNEEIVLIGSTDAISKAPIGEEAKARLIADAVASKAAGEPDMLIAVHAATAAKLDGKSGVEPKGWCDDYTLTKRPNATLSKNLTYEKKSEGDFTGSVLFEAQATGSADAEVKMKVKRSGWSLCIPYAVVFKRARVHGKAVVKAGLTVNAEFTDEWKWNKAVANPTLASFPFMAGPIPVVLGIGAPIRVGVDASGAASLTVKGTATASGELTYDCTGSSCQQVSANASQGWTEDGSPTVAVTGKVKVNPWASVGLRVFLYDDWPASAEVGVRTTLESELWGYAGNNCGDANHDGVNETIMAATLDARVAAGLYVGLSALGEDRWFKQWTLGRSSHWFKDLSLGNALSPMFWSTSASTHGGSITLVGQMRPCWPYTDNVIYELTRPDGSKETVTSAPQTAFTKVYSVPTTSSATATLKAVRDSSPRTLGMSTTRLVPRMPIGTIYSQL
ncbi:MAG TPA: hypothetical protein PLI95_17535 [Polyangiaceae bacterium]|nr:hypothetical protein [Polyangiaceae bacterium]